MRFEDLPKAERDALAEYGYEVAAEMEAMDEPAPGDPTLDPRYDPSRELRRLNYQRHALDREIEAAVAASRGHGQSCGVMPIIRKVLPSKATGMPGSMNSGRLILLRFSSGRSTVPSVSSSQSGCIRRAKTC